MLTYLDGPDRVELSGSTVANWVAKTANLLTDGYAAPARVGLLLPLHWQTVCLLLGGVAAGATVVVGAQASDLGDCPVAFTAADDATAALDAGVEDVFACSLTPFATRLSVVPPLALDAALEIPTYGDHFGGRPGAAHLELEGAPFSPPALPVSGTDRVLVSTPLHTASGLGALLGALVAGAAVVLLRSGDLDAAVAAESVTVVAERD